MSAPDDAVDPIIERADDKDAWIGLKQGDQEDRDRDIQAAIEAERERIAVAIETHWLCSCTTYCAIRNTAKVDARIARNGGAS